MAITSALPGFRPRASLGYRLWRRASTEAACLGCVALISGMIYLPAHAQDASYLRESTHIYDEARIIDQKDFAPPSLLKEFRHFATVECGRRKLARLTLAPSQNDLARAVNVSFVLDDLTSEGVARIASSNPTLLGQNIGRLSVAQAYCMSGNVTAVIRNEFSIERHQLAGRKDSRELNLGKLDVRLVGFNLHGGRDEWISAFVRVKFLPDLDTAAAIRDLIEEQIGVQALLVLRTDPFFWDMGGPKFDPFEVPVPEISAGEFLIRPYISCPPSEERKPCRLESSH
jgi:hypothetical protein